ncbi:MAG: 2-C-methyl-D-erythritol 4-phosphate cytidylyltransferase [Pseudobutyrivibrio sp.]|nr:2-C-methyl-D-erythritol 4-phosphate cytidylyltransferase [Pseudobutyrivibrio sp.]
MNIALILSGGTGSRLGGNVPKQYVELNGRAVISYCLNTVLEMAEIDAVVIVAASQWQDYIKDQIKDLPDSGISVSFAEPGDTRQLSILNGLREMSTFSQSEDKVIIHDAARPLVSANLIRELLEVLDEHEAVMPVLPMKDTVYLGKEGRIEAMLERKHVLAGQAPEGFLFGKYIKACESLLPDEILRINGSTEPALLAGMDVVYIDGEESNFKITTPADFKRFKAIIEGGK